MSRAALVQHAAPADETGDRSVALLQQLAAVIVVVGGAHFDSSIMYGNASVFSVVLHGLALQQLGYGLWKLVR
jgi:hypothetical protein